MEYDWRTLPGLPKAPAGTMGNGRTSDLCSSGDESSSKPMGSGRSRSPFRVVVVVVVVLAVVVVVVVVDVGKTTFGDRVAKTGAGSEGLNGTCSLLACSWNIML